MTTDFPTAPPAYGLEGPSAGRTVEKSLSASHTEILTLPTQFDQRSGAVAESDFAVNGLALVVQDGKNGYIDHKGKMVIPAQFESAYRFAANGLAAVKQNERYGYIDHKGNIVIAAQFKHPQYFATNGLARIEQDGKQGYINAKGQMVIPAKFDGSWYESEGVSGFLCVRRRGTFPRCGLPKVPLDRRRAARWESRWSFYVRLASNRSA